MANGSAPAPGSIPILILPGINDSGPAHWQSLWQASIPGARRVLQRDWDNPDCEAWVAALAREVDEVCGGKNDREGQGAGVVLVAHSLGCLLVAHAAASSSPSRDLLARNVRGALLVAPPDPDAISFPTDIARGFDPLPLSPLPFPSVVVASRDDPYVAFRRAIDMAKAWGAELVDIGEAGHINTGAGYGEWPEGERLLARLQRGAVIAGA